MHGHEHPIQRGHEQRRREERGRWKGGSQTSLPIIKEGVKNIGSIGQPTEDEEDVRGLVRDGVY